MVSLVHDDELKIHVAEKFGMVQWNGTFTSESIR